MALADRQEMALVLKCEHKLSINQRIPLFLDDHDQLLSSTCQNSFLA